MLDKTISVVEAEGVQECRSLQLAAVLNHNLLAGLSTLAPVGLNLFDNIHAFNDPAEHHVLAIQPGNKTNILMQAAIGIDCKHTSPGRQSHKNGLLQHLMILGRIWTNWLKIRYTSAAPNSPGCCGSCQEELGSICVGSSVGHRQDTCGEHKTAVCKETTPQCTVFPSARLEQRVQLNLFLNT